MRQKIFFGVTLLIFLMGFVFANQVFPHAFEGEIIALDSSDPDDHILIGLIDDVPVSSAVISGTHFDIVVEDFSGSGGVVSFKIGDEEAAETFNFVLFEKTDTNLTFTVIPDVVEGCGDAICQEGECSTCPADCSVNQCVGDGICSLNVGEDCSNSPDDCGICQDDNSGNSNNNNGGSSGGGGGGGGGGSSNNDDIIVLGANSSDSQTINTAGDNGDDSIIPTISDLNENTENAEVERPRGFFSFITGNVIGNGDNGIDGLGLALIILFVLILAYFFTTTFRS